MQVLASVGGLWEAISERTKASRTHGLHSKLGWAYTPHDDHVAVERLVRETMAALQSEE
jgi:hypothetical protein